MLAAAPVGAWMLLPVVVAVLADEHGDDPTLPVLVRDAIVALGELLARADPGGPTERVGPIHDLIADFLTARLDPEAVEGTHTAIAQALTDPNRTDESGSVAVAAYAKDRLSEHYLAAGRPEEALSALPELSTPADNLAQWRSWHARLQPTLGGDHPDVLTTRGNIAAWTRAALELYAGLLPDRVRVLGVGAHPDVLRTRGNIVAPRTVP